MGVLTNEKPERTWIDWPQPNATGLAFSCQARPPALRTEYVRADLVDEAIARIEALEAALQKQRTAWNNALELDLLPEQHRQSAEFLRDEAASLLEKKP